MSHNVVSVAVPLVSAEIGMLSKMASPNSAQVQNFATRES